LSSRLIFFMSGACGSPLDIGERALRYFSRSVGEIEFLCKD
jgi:hypothetical protein